MSITQSTPPSLAIAQAIGITSSVFLLGQNVSLSLVAIPAVMRAPSPLAVQQWHTVYTYAGFYARPLAILSAVATGAAAWHQDPRSLPFKLNLLSTILLPSIIPLTLLLIGPTNSALLAKRDQLAATSLTDKAAEAGVSKEESVHALIDRWGVLNLARAGVVGVGAVCAVVAGVVKREGVNAVIGVRSGADRF